MSKPTLKDVAKEAGVSLSTASLVLNKKGQISQDVRDRVYEAAKKLDYTKSIYTPSGARRFISYIAILVFEDAEKAFIWDFFRRMIVPLESTITKQHHYPIIIPVSLNHDTSDILEKIVVSNAKALFSIDYGNQELFQRLEDQGIPVVVINNSSFQTYFHTVCVDDFHGAYEGTRYLSTLGHTHIAYIEYHRPDMLTLLNDRFIGFKKALDEENLSFPEDHRLTIDLFDMDELQRELQKLFQKKHRPTALFVHDDYLAARTIVALQNMQLGVPEDVSIIAPGDTLDYSQPFIPQITTMRINNELMGKLAGEMLLERLKHPQEDIHVLKVNQQLIERGSCKQIPKERN
jgi:DNA-binding LacI/PurR family transcriptional regulator